MYRKRPRECDNMWFVNVLRSIARECERVCISIIPEHRRIVRFRLINGLNQNNQCAVPLLLANKCRVVHIFSKERHHCSVMSEYFRWNSTIHISIERTEYSNKIATIIYALKLCHINKYIKPNRNPQLNSFARCWIITRERERAHYFMIAFVSNICAKP